MENIKRIGSYPAIYEKSEIENMDEVNIFEMEDYAKNNNRVYLAIRNLDDSTKCKICKASIRTRKYDEWKNTYDSRYFIVL